MKSKIFTFNILKSVFLPFCAICRKSYVVKYGLCFNCFKNLEQPNLKVFSSQIKYLFDYKGINKELILAYKRDGIKSLASLFAQTFSLFLKEDALVVPAPASFKRLLFYGWNHMELIAYKLFKIYKVPYALLIRRKIGKTQKRLKLKERLSNLENKLYFNRDLKLNFNFESIYILDDIITTGSTLRISQALIEKNLKNSLKVQCLALFKA